MTNYYATDFESYPTGAAPSDWASKWTSRTWSVVAGQYLQGVANSTYAWAAIAAPVTVSGDNDGLLVKVQFSSNSATGVKCFAVMRGSGAASSETGYVIDVTASPVAASTNQLRLQRASGGTFTVLATASKTCIPATWYWMRAHIDSGGVIRVRVWESGSAEPDTWDIAYNDANTILAGWYGVGVRGINQTYLFDDFAVYDDAAASVSIRASLDQLWGDAPIVGSALDQPWGIRMGADLSQRWSDAPVIKSMLNQPWGNAGVIRAQLVQRWRDMVTLRAQLDQPWAIMESLLVALEQPWSITATPVQTLLNQGWSIKDITPVLAALHQPWSLAADGTVLRYTVEVLADGQPVRVSHVNIEGGLDESGDVLTCEIHPETEAEYLLCPFGAELQVSITSQEGTDAFVFVVTDPRINEQHGSTSYVVEAMSPAAMLGAPYAAVIDGELSGQASEIAASLAGDLSISWETVDWNTPAATWIASGETPLALLKTLAAAVGALVQSDPDGTIAIRPRYPVSVPKWATDPPDVILTETLDCFENGSTPDHRYGYNRFLISNQSSSADSLTLEQTDISGIVKEVRGYQVPWDGLFDLTHTGGDWVIIEPMGIEERKETETVEFVAGAGSTRYPIHGLVSVAWQQTNLGTITTSEDGSLTSSITGQSLCEITYTTRCRLWKVTDGNNEQLQLVAEL